MQEADKLLTALVENHRTPSVQYAIFNKDHIIHSFLFGFADIQNQKKVEERTTYNAYSITKTFTALAVLQLAERKKLHIDHGVKQYFNDFPYSAEITIRQLLAHSGGIPNPNPLAWIHLPSEHNAFDSRNFFKPIFKKYAKPRSRPNRKFAYSNLGYVLLGQLIEKVSGQTYEDYIRNQILRPLELSPEELDFEIFDEGQHARGYQKQRTLMNAILGFFMDKSKFMGPAEGKWKPFNPFYVNGAAYGGLIGNINAFVTYIQELLRSDSRLLSNEYKKMLFTPNCTIDGTPTKMCLSWFNGELNGVRYLHHAGGGGGYYCEARIYPKIGLGSVVMFNRSGMTDERFLDKPDIHFIDNKS